jgi:hypothetical protein
MEGSQQDIDIAAQQGYTSQATHELTGCGRETVGSLEGQSS